MTKKKAKKSVKKKSAVGRFAQKVGSLGGSVAIVGADNGRGIIAGETARGSNSTTKKKAKKKKISKSVGTCFVLMPFKEPFDLYYASIIEPGVRKAGLEPLRCDSLFLPTPIMGDIWKMIQDAKVLLAELTGKNANVFYELGLAHAVGKPIVLISETMEDVPFDLQALRVILYNKNDPKWGERLRVNIIESLKATLKEPVDAVPPMFRKKVKSQAPEESELSMRVAVLEQQLRSLRERASGRMMERMNRVEAEQLLINYKRQGMPPSMIVERLVENGVPREWVLDRLGDFSIRKIREH